MKTLKASNLSKSSPPRIYRKEIIIMTTIKNYQNKKGEELFQFNLYTGINPQTGKKQYTTRRGFKSQKEATKELARLELEVENGGVKKVNNSTFEEVYINWFKSYQNTVRESTCANTKRIFKKFILPRFGILRIRTITVEQCQEAINDWFETGNTSYRLWLSYSANIFDYALKQGLINRNPAKLVTVPKPKENYGDEPENFWDKSELEKFFSCIDVEQDRQKYTLFRVLAFSGMRKGECLAITWDDINFKDKTIRINKTLSTGANNLIIQPPKTKKSKRTISMDSITMDYLQKWHTEQGKFYLMLGYNTFGKEQLVFANRNNRFMSLVQPNKWLNDIIKDNNLAKITVHGFRHSHASALFAANVSLKEVQVRLGHANIQTTMNIYAHVTKEQNQEAVSKFANYMAF